MNEILDIKPPILGSWVRIYGLILAFLAAEVLLFTWLTLKFTI